MYRHAVWICCLAIVGCEAPPTDIVELHVSEQLALNVKVTSIEPPTTLMMTYDKESNVTYVSKTVHDCDAKRSTLNYLAVFDSDKRLIGEHNVEIDVNFELGSIAEAELKLACQSVPIKGLT